MQLSQPDPMTPRLSTDERIAQMVFASVYPHYVTKVEKKGHTEDDLLKVICWLTGYTKAQVRKHLDEGSNLEEFFAGAELHPNAHLIKGVVCGVRVEEVEEPLMREIRYLDKLIDELARGKALEKILRS